MAVRGAPEGDLEGNRPGIAEVGLVVYMTNTLKRVIKQYGFNFLIQKSKLEVI